MKFFSVFGLMLIAATVAAQQTESPESQGLMSQLRQLHEKAMQSGADVPANLTDWAKRDLASAGNWEYKVVSLPATDDAKLEQTLNALGSERWEAFSIQSGEQSLRVLLKRPVRTYLQSLPMMDLLNRLPGSDQGG